MNLYERSITIGVIDCNSGENENKYKHLCNSVFYNLYDGYTINKLICVNDDISDIQFDNFDCMILMSDHDDSAPDKLGYDDYCTILEDERMPYFGVIRVPHTLTESSKILSGMLYVYLDNLRESHNDVFNAIFRACTQIGLYHRYIMDRWKKWTGSLEGMENMQIRVNHNTIDYDRSLQPPHHCSMGTYDDEYTEDGTCVHNIIEYGGKVLIIAVASFLVWYFF